MLCALSRRKKEEEGERRGWREQGGRMQAHAALGHCLQAEAHASGGPCCPPLPARLDYPLPVCPMQLLLCIGNWCMFVAWMLTIPWKVGSRPSSSAPPSVHAY